MKKLQLLSIRAKSLYFAFALALALTMGAGPALADAGTDPTTELTAAATGYITNMGSSAKNILIAAFTVTILFTVYKVIRKGSSKV